MVDTVKKGGDYAREKFNNAKTAVGDRVADARGKLNSKQIEEKKQMVKDGFIKSMDDQVCFRKRDVIFANDVALYRRGACRNAKEYKNMRPAALKPSHKKGESTKGNAVKPESKSVQQTNRSAVKPESKSVEHTIRSTENPKSPSLTSPVKTLPTPKPSGKVHTGPQMVFSLSQLIRLVLQ